MLFTENNRRHVLFIETLITSLRINIGNGIYNHGRSYVFTPVYLIPERLINTARGNPDFKKHPDGDNKLLHIGFRNPIANLGFGQLTVT